ncbi:uncharacterized protein LOC128581029 [Nycticebus coucang]|uniref:uncharacterized protein LOC128581029 n=1 Tax=Nycticebus coucang TaxID=9470 RepID=UPI00234C5786|nr:uncharacterized protein LOC128581029 [Nycticebus coucang]
MSSATTTPPANRRFRFSRVTMTRTVPPPLLSFCPSKCAAFSVEEPSQGWTRRVQESFQKRCLRSTGKSGSFRPNAPYPAPEKARPEGQRPRGRAGTGPTLGGDRVVGSEVESRTFETEWELNPLEPGTARLKLRIQPCAHVADRARELHKTALWEADSARRQSPALGPCGLSSSSVAARVLRAPGCASLSCSKGIVLVFGVKIFASRVSLGDILAGQVTLPPLHPVTHVWLSTLDHRASLPGLQTPGFLSYQEEAPINALVNPSWHLGPSHPGKEGLGPQELLEGRQLQPLLSKEVPHPHCLPSGPMRTTPTLYLTPAGSLDSLPVKALGWPMHGMTSSVLTTKTFKSWAWGGACGSVSRGPALAKLQQKNCRAFWRAPIVPATWEAEARKWPKPRSWRLL